MISPLASARYTQSIGSLGSEARGSRPVRESARGDTISFSDEAYSALEAHEQRKAQEAAAAAARKSAFGTALVESQVGTEAASEENEIDLLAELKEYVNNPVLKQAMDKMEKAIESMDYDKWTAETVLEHVKASFRSGIPAEGERTTDVLKNLTKNIKDDTALNDADIAKLMEKISRIVADAQKYEPDTVTDDGSSRETETA